MCLHVTSRWDGQRYWSALLLLMAKCGVVSEEKSSKTGVIVGSVLGSVAFIAIIVGVLVYYFKRPNKVGHSDDAAGGNGDADHEVHNGDADHEVHNGDADHKGRP